MESEDLTVTIRVACRPCGVIMKGTEEENSTFACPSCGQQVDLQVSAGPDVEVVE